MALRPGRTIKKRKRPYTRVSKKKPRKSYVGGAPHSKLHIFEMGNRTGEFEVSIFLVSRDDVNIRSNALEAARVSVQKVLEPKLGVEHYKFKILVYPHHVIREHSIAMGAGADRFSQGMRKAFGRPANRAAIVDKDQRIFRVDTSRKNLKVVKAAFKRASSKIRCKTRMEVVDN